MTEPTDNKPKPRVVSRGQYLQFRIVKATWSVVGFVLDEKFKLGPMLLTTWLFVRNVDIFGRYLQNMSVWVFIGFISMMPWLFVKIGLFARKRASIMERVVLMTHNHTADLPAQESLVRASSEPAQPPQEILLRAVQSGEETPANQLLRPHGEEVRT